MKRERERNGDRRGIKPGMSERIRRVLTYVRVSGAPGAVTRLKGTEVGRECRLGQSEECEIFIRKAGVARPVHALLLVRDAARPGATLVNASAGAPTLLNGTPVATEAAVHSGDLISICQRHFLYEEFALVTPGPAVGTDAIDTDTERVAATAEGSCDVSGERLAAPVPVQERSELSVSQPPRACVSEPPHVSGRREQQQGGGGGGGDEQQQQQRRAGDEQEERIGFGIDFPVRRDCSLFVQPGDDDTSQGTGAQLGSTGDSLEQVAAESSTSGAPVPEPEPEPLSVPVPTTKEASSPQLDAEQPQEQQQQQQQQRRRRTSTSETCAALAGVRVVVGPCTDVARVVRCVMECGGRVGTLAAATDVVDDTESWDSHSPRTVFVARADADATRLGAAGVLALALRVPVVAEPWVAACRRARTRAPLSPYLLRIAIPGTAPSAPHITQPLPAASALASEPLLVAQDGHCMRFRLAACDAAGRVRRDDVARRALQPLERLVRHCGGALAMETRHTYDATLVAVVDEPPVLPGTPQRKRPRIDEDLVDATDAPPLLCAEWLFACVLCGKLLPTEDYLFDVAKSREHTSLHQATTAAEKPKEEEKEEAQQPREEEAQHPQEKTSPSRKRRKSQSSALLLDGMQFILDATADTARVQRAIETHRGRVVRALPRRPESERAQWAQPRLVFLTERERVDALSGIVALCLACAVPVVRLQWLDDCVRARTRLAVAPYLLPVLSARAGTLAQPLAFALQDPAADTLFAAAPSRFVQLRVVGRDGHELSSTATKSLLVCIFLSYMHACMYVRLFGFITENSTEKRGVAGGHYGRRHCTGNASPLSRQRVHHRQQP